MIVDLNTVPSGSPIRCDVCIIGCGAVGMAIALELMRGSVQTVVLESGTEEDDPRTQALYDCEIVGHPFGGATSGRFRVVGGSTTRWGGQALPMDATDFEPRDWVAHSGWPIGLAEVFPYYVRAAEYMRVDAGDYSTVLARRLGAIPPAVDGALLRYHFSKWAPRPSLRDLYVTEFHRAPNLRLYTRANVTRIDLKSSLEAVSCVTVRSLQGASTTVKARYFVLAAGGLESARLLLANTHQVPSGIGNQHDCVGRFFQDHPTARVGSITTSDPRQLQRVFNLFYRHGQKYAVRLSASEAFQRILRTVNLSSGVTFEAPADSPVATLKRVYRRMRGHGVEGSALRELAGVAGSGMSLVRPAYEFLLKGRQYVPDARYMVHVVSEQEPDPSSRISLSDRCDELGMRKARIDWRLPASTGRSIRLFARVLRDELRRLRLGSLSLAPWLDDSEENWREHIQEAYHHIGTTRMHDDPRRGVLDRRCRVHGVDNLYVAGASVFPTGGHSNPTFTALALAFRTSDELKSAMRAA